MCFVTKLCGILLLNFVALFGRLAPIRSVIWRNYFRQFGIILFGKMAEFCLGNNRAQAKNLATKKREPYDSLRVECGARTHEPKLQILVFVCVQRGARLGYTEDRYSRTDGNGYPRHLRHESDRGDDSYMLCRHVHHRVHL